MLADGTVTPQIHEVMDMSDAAKAHELLDSGAVSGKIVLTV
ncbi:zinc-binding dehydrogenase [Corynebacterium sp. UMB4614]|nr:zinc-binding dehydrogenase [Corynebacterium sp. UMB4614]MDK7135875.1 zinc-binding dehydrogenase [Corynebacterium sp. UMB4614]